MPRKSDPRKRSAQRAAGERRPRTGGGSVDTRARAPDRGRAETAVRDLLHALGFDLAHPALAETPRRVVEAYLDAMIDGYEASPAATLGSGFPVDHRGPIVATGIPVSFMCPHHLLPARGRVHLAFEPRARVPGLSRLTRLVDVLAHRLVLQEDLGLRIAEALRTHLGARAAVVIVDAEHGCVAVEDFARRDTSFRTHASAGPRSAVASLTERIGATLEGDWRTSASERMSGKRGSRSPSPSAGTSAGTPKRRTSSRPRRRSPSDGS